MVANDIKNLNLKVSKLIEINVYFLIKYYLTNISVYISNHIPRTKHLRLPQKYLRNSKEDFKL